MGEQSTISVDEVPAPLLLPSAGDTEQLVRAAGTSFLVTNRKGDVSPPGARELGFFARDTRYLSHFELTIPGAELVHLSSVTSADAYNQIDLMVSGLEQGDVLDDPQNYLHVQRRQLVDGDLVERLEFTSYLRTASRIIMRVEFAADFADIFEVRGARRPRRGRLLPSTVLADSVELEYRGLDGLTYSTLVTFSPAPATLLPNEATYEIALEPGEKATIEILVRPGRDGTAVHPLSPSFDDRSAGLVTLAEAFRASSARFTCDNAMIQLVLDQSRQDLHSLRTVVGAHSVLAAGIPWFCCPFGRDTLIASYAALPLDSSFAVESLRALSLFQGTKFDEDTEEEPGKIFHELRFGEMTGAGEMPHRPYYGSIDATPLFVIVADATYRMTANAAFLREMEGPLLRALEWIDRRSDEGRQLVTYARASRRGLDNQGWKDSRAGVPFPDGRLADAPIALCEVQGYCVDAYVRGARVLRYLGRHELAQTYEKRSHTFRDLVDGALWLEDLGRYAYAVDGRGRKVDTVVSNLGHLLWSRIPNQSRALAIAELLTTSASFSGFGVRTLARGQPAYNPLSYHNGTVWPHDNALVAKGFANYRLTGHATKVFEGLVAAMPFFRDWRLPELFCGFGRERGGGVVQYPVACRPQAWAASAPFLLLQSILGIHADGPAGRLSIRNASMPPSMKRLDIEGLRIGEATVNIGFRRSGERVHVERLDVRGAPLRTEIEID